MAGRGKKVTGSGDCFEAAGSFLAFASDAPEDAYLCHAIVYGTGGDVESLWYVHAWVEYEEPIPAPEASVVFVIDRSNGNEACIPAALYYAIGHPRCVRRYTRDEARKNMYSSGHYGPWDDKLFNWEPQAALPPLDEGDENEPLCSRGHAPRRNLP